MSKKVRRVETLYSYKLPDGSLLPRGVYSVDSPKGIPEAVIKDALKGRTTVRVLEWEEVKKAAPAAVSTPEPEEVVTTLDEEKTVETTDVEEKPKKTVRKRK